MQSFAAEEPGDAQFCADYADTVSVAADDAIALNKACLNPGSGVHGNKKMHKAWCGRTPRSEVEGASIHIRRLASKCTNGALVAPNDYGDYDIVGSEQFERSYGKARQWVVNAAYSGRTFMYCVAELDDGDRHVRLGGGWQLAVPVKAPPSWEGRIEVDGQEPGHRAGADIMGVSVAGWAIAWPNMGQIDALRDGKMATISVGKFDYDFALTGIAAALTKLEECRERRGMTVADSSPSVSVSASLEPAAFVEAIYGEAMAGRNPFDRGTRANYLSRRLLQLIEEDERVSAANQEPGKLDYSLLSGDQDELVVSGLKVEETSREENRASVRVRYRNTVAGASAKPETVVYQLQNSKQGWRIINIRYGGGHNLLATLKP